MTRKTPILAAISLGLAVAFLLFALSAGQGAAGAFAPPAPLAALAGEAPRLGMPAHGDSVHYRHEDGSLAFRWNGTGVREDGFGRPLDVDLVVGAMQIDGDDTPLVFEASYAGTARPVAYAWTNGGTGGMNGLMGEYSWRGAYRSYDDAPNPEACLVRAEWQGRTIAQIVGERVEDLCPALRGEEGYESTPFELQAPMEVEGVEASVVRGVASTAHGKVAMRLWLVPGLAYPVRANFDYQFWTGYVTERTYELVGFEPGAAPLVASPAPPAPAQREGMLVAPVGQWGIVEGDASAYPFAPSEAIAALQDPVAMSGFLDYLATHPDARVIAYQLSYDASTRQAGVARPWIWTFEFNDPSGEGWLVQARKATTLEGPVPVAIPVSPAVGIDLGPRTYPPLDPAALPIVSVAGSDVIRSWTEERATSDGAVNWLWGLLQVETVEAFHGVDAFVRVGRREVALQPSGALVQDATDAAWRDHVPATGALSGEAGGLFGDVYGVDAGPLAASGGWSVPAPVAEARQLRSYVAPVAGGLAAGAIALLLIERGPRAFIALFSRLAPGDALRHPRRAALLQAIRDEPGVHGARLAERLGIGNGALLYHLSVLERERVVAAVEDGRIRRYFAAGTLSRDAMQRESLLRTPSFARLHAAIAASPGISLKDAATAAGLAPNTAHHAVDRLVDAGLVRRERIGRQVALHAVEPELARFA